MTSNPKSMPDQEALVDQHESKEQSNLNSSEVGGYNPLACPPDIQKAIKHAQARKVGRVNPKDPDMEFCEDCGLPSKNEDFDLFGSRLDLADLGPGFPLYYEYVFFCGVLLLGLFGIVGVYSMMANNKGQTCDVFQNVTDQEYTCDGGFIVKYSLGNRSNYYRGFILGIDNDSDKSIQICNILNIIYTVLGLLASFYYRRIQAMTADEVNRGAITTSDYTVIVKNIPLTENSETIQKFFEEKGRPRVKSVVRKVVLAYEIGPYVELVRKRNTLQDKKSKMAKDENSTAIDAEIKDFDDKIQLFESQVSQDSSQKFTGIAFITFDTEKEARGVIQKYNMSEIERVIHIFLGGCLKFLGIQEDKTFNGKLVALERAPEPLDVFWENLGYGWWEVQQKRLLTLLSSFVLVGMSFGMILGISLLQQKIVKSQGSNSSNVGITLLSLLSSFLITLINGFIGFFMRKLAGYEKHTTYTYYFVSVASKLSLAQFSNTALITYFVQLIIRGEEGILLWTKDSIIQKVFFLFVLNAILPSLSYIINPFYLMRVYKRSKIMSDGANSKATQQEANLTFEGPPFDIAQRYANIQKTMLFSAFYACIFPLGVAISLGGLVLTYWTDKYMLLRRHCRPNTLGKELAENMADFLELFFVAFCAGNCIFTKVARGDPGAINIIALIISIVLYVLPNGWMASCILKNDDSVYNTKKYDECRVYFATEYDRVNPITQEDAIREWIMEMSQNDNPEVLDPNQPANKNDKKAELASYFQHMPKQTTMGNLANYANVKPSFQQMNNMSLGNNFMSHLPQQNFGPSPMMGGNNPAFRPQMNMNPQFNNQMRPGLNQPYYQMQMQPNWGGNQFRPQISAHMPMNNVSIQIRPQIASHVPQQNQPMMNQQRPQPQIQIQPQPQQIQPQSHLPQNNNPQSHIPRGPTPQNPQSHFPQNNSPVVMNMSQPQQPLMNQQYQRSPMMAQPQVVQIGQPNPYGQPQPGFQQPMPMMYQQQQQQPQYAQPKPENKFDSAFKSVENGFNSAFGKF